MAAPLVHGDLCENCQANSGKSYLFRVTGKHSEEESGISTAFHGEDPRDLACELQHNGAISDLLKCGHLMLGSALPGTLVDSTKDARKFTAIIEPTRLETAKLERDETPIVLPRHCSFSTSGGGKEILWGYVPD